MPMLASIYVTRYDWKLHGCENYADSEIRDGE